MNFIALDITGWLPGIAREDKHRLLQLSVKVVGRPLSILLYKSDLF